MNQPMIVWCVIAGVLLCAFVFRAIERYYVECRHNNYEPVRLFELGKEREMFYVPGDSKDGYFEEDDFDE